MKLNIVAAAILALGLVVAAFIFSGRYYFLRLDQCTVARGDRLTGSVEVIQTFDSKACKDQLLAW